MDLPYVTPEAFCVFNFLLQDSLELAGRHCKPNEGEDSWCSPECFVYKIASVSSFHSLLSFRPGLRRWARQRILDHAVVYDQKQSGHREKKSDTAVYPSLAPFERSNPLSESRELSSTHAEDFVLSREQLVQLNR